MNELPLRGSYENIVTAELLRTGFSAEKNSQALAELEEVVWSRLPHFEELSVSEQAVAVGGVRIMLAIYREQMRGAVNFDQALAWAGKSRGLLRNLLTEQRMQMIRGLKQDGAGNASTIGDELYRDIASTYLVYGHLFGDQTFEEQAISLLEQVGTNGANGVRQQARWEATFRRALRDEPVGKAMVIGTYISAQEVARGQVERRVTNAGRAMLLWDAPEVVVRGVWDAASESFRERADKDAVRRNGKIVARELVRPVFDFLYRQRMRRTRGTNVEVGYYQLCDEVEMARRVLG